MYNFFHIAIDCLGVDPDVADFSGNLFAAWSYYFEVGHQEIRIQKKKVLLFFFGRN